MKQMLKHFRVDIVVTLAALVIAYLYGGSVQTLVLAAMLIAMEIVFSFDNAAVNAKYLAKMSHFWRKMFLTVGVLIAVFGMRLVFPFVIVCLAGSIGPFEAWNLAMEKGDPHTPGTYGYILEQAHPSIAAFGGMFLFMLFASFLFDSDREITWLGWIEKPLLKLGNFDSMPAVASLIVLLLSAVFLTDDAHRLAVLEAGALGILVFLLVNGLSAFMEERQEIAEQKLAQQEQRALAAGQTFLLTGQAAFSMFLFLEVMDASFSFDGVLGAFALTSDPILIALGLGVGALFVRSMTVYLVDNNALTAFPYLEHGAHWAIGVLSTLLLLTLHWDIPDVLIGLAGLVLITAAILTSVHANRRAEAVGDREVPQGTQEPAVAGAAPGIYSSQAGVTGFPDEAPHVGDTPSQS